VSLTAIVGALGVAVGIAVAFGVYPATRAARLARWSNSSSAWIITRFIR